MAVSLKKGGSISLTKEEPGLESVIVGLGWDVRSTDGADFDLDASCFLLCSIGQVRRDSDFVFYNNTKSECGAVVYLGDNRTGEGAGDDEQITVDLKKVDEEIQKVTFAATIYDGEERHQNFGMVSNAYIRVLNQKTGKEIARFDLSEDASTSTAIIFGELIRDGDDWKFHAIGQGHTGGLATVAQMFGLEV